MISSLCLGRSINQIFRGKTGVLARGSSTLPVLYNGFQRVSSRRSSASSGRNEFGSPKYMGYDRPLSPDVTIYKFPMPAVSSIIFRATGTAATLAMVSVAIPIIIFPHLALSAVTVIKGYPLLLTLVKIFVSFPLVYHSLAGLRHLFWDYSSRGLENYRDVDRSSRLLLYASVIITILLAFIDW